MKQGDIVRVVSYPARPDHEGKTGVVKAVLDVGGTVYAVRVRLDDPGDSKWVEVDGTVDKFELPKSWRSIAVWPDTIKVGNEVGKNESDDTHSDREAAQAVCDLLQEHGFGGDGKVFPFSTRIEPVFEGVEP